jgi:hypothetical protein
MSIPIPKDVARRLVSGMPSIIIVDEEDLEPVIKMIKLCVLEGDWLIEFGDEGKSVDYVTLHMNNSVWRDACIDAMRQFVARVTDTDDWSEWWIAIMPLRDWKSTTGAEKKLEQAAPPDKLEVFTYEYCDEVINPMFNWTTPLALCKRLVDMGSLNNVNIVSRYILRKDLEARPTMPFVSDYVREAFNIAPYRYWKGKQNGQD